MQAWFWLLKNYSEIGLIGRRNDKPSCSLSVRGVLKFPQPKDFGEPAERFFLIGDENGN
jgi:hypothetical protein